MTNFGIEPNSFGLSSMHYDVLIKRWNDYIYSNSGLFSKTASHPKILGPKLSPSGSVQGDMMMTENMHFENLASPEQKMLHRYLLSVDKSKANQYLLTIIDGVEIWKDDVKVLRRLLSKFTDSEHLLDEEIKDIMLDDIERIKRIRELIGEILTQNEIFMMTSDMNKFIKDLQEEKSRLHKIVDDIKKHLEVLKDAYSFLF